MHPFFPHRVTDSAGFVKANSIATFPIEVASRTLFFVFGLFLALVAIPLGPPIQAKEPYDQALCLESFDHVWQTIQDVHWDPELTGKTWTKIRAEYRPRAEKAATIDEMRSVIQSMLAELEQSHFSVIPKESYKTVSPEQSGDATPGITIRIIDGEAIVTKVSEGSPAEQTGIKPGWELKSINGKPVTDVLEQVRKAAHGPTRFETLAAVTLGKSLSGNAGTKLELELINSMGEHQTLQVPLTEQKGILSKYGNLPPMRVTWSEKTYPGNIGYFTFNLFFAPMEIMPAFRSFVHNEDHASGLIIDLRGNIGGLGPMTMGMASAMSDKETKLGTMKMKSGDMNFAVQESIQPVTCPVAVLIDEASISSAEIFSGGLQDLGIARVFGTRSAGLALPAYVAKLPNGDGFQYAVASYVSQSGRILEANGVVPDETIKLSKELLIQESDPVLSRAIQWINSENETKTP